jgi:hypothetical protein
MKKAFAFVLLMLSAFVTPVVRGQQTAPQRFKGIDPWADITAFGGRAVSPVPSTKASCNGSTTIAVASSSGFFIGDGITVSGCGSTNKMSMPTAPTVVPSETTAEPGMGLGTQTRDGSAAKSTYAYSVVARDRYGALTAAGPTTTITNGPTTLGEITYSIRSITRSGNNVKVVTSIPNLMSPGTGLGGTMVCISNTPGQQFNGCFDVAQRDSSTQFEFFNTPIDTHGMGNYAGDVLAESSGSATIFVDNLISWTPVTGAWEYYIYAKRPGDSAQHLIGVTQPQGIQNGFLDTVFEDYGSPFLDNQTFPAYVPVTPPPTVATNDPLTTTITNISGTTVTVANAASQTSSGQTALFDDAPAILAAGNSISYFHSGFGSDALRGGAIYIPQAPSGCAASCAFVVNSYLQLPEELTILQSGLVLANETIAIKSNVNWDGIWGQTGTPQFGYSGSAQVRSLTANPLLYIYGTGALFQNLYLCDNNTNGGVLAVEDNSAPTTWEDVGFEVNGAGNSSYWGRDLILRDTTGTINNQYFYKVLFGGGPAQVPNSSWTPLVFFDGEGTVTLNFSAEFHDTQIGRRGFAILQTGAGSGLAFNNLYRQGGIAPLVTSFSTGGGVGVSLSNATQDTETEPAFTNLGKISTRPIGSFDFSGGGGAGDPVLSGLLVQAYNATAPFSANTQPTPNREGKMTGSTTVVAPPYSTSAIGGCGTPWCPIPDSLAVFNQLVSFGDGHSLIWPLAQATNVSTTVASGGGVPVGTWTYAVIEVGADGGFTIASLPSNAAATTIGNQTVNLTWTRSQGAIAHNVYRCSSKCVSAAGLVNINSEWYRVATAITTTSYSDNAAAPMRAFLPYVTGTGKTIVSPSGFSGLSSRLIPETFAVLPTCGSGVGEGTVSEITDSVTNILGATVTGGGSHKGTVRCDGVNWTLEAISGPSAAIMVATLSTTAATTDNVTVTGLTTSGHCTMTPTNATAAADIASTYISKTTTNQITITHPARSGRTWNIHCTAN